MRPESKACSEGVEAYTDNMSERERCRSRVCSTLMFICKMSPCVTPVGRGCDSHKVAGGSGGWAA